MIYKLTIHYDGECELNFYNYSLLKTILKAVQGFSFNCWDWIKIEIVLKEEEEDGV